MPNDPELQHSVAPGQEPATAPASDVAQSPEQDALLGGSQVQTNTVMSVQWNPSWGGESTPLAGTLTVEFALQSNFSYFVASGVLFNITSLPSATTVNFTYEGPQSERLIKDLLVARAWVAFG